MPIATATPTADRGIARRASAARWSLCANRMLAVPTGRCRRLAPQPDSCTAAI